MSKHTKGPWAVDFGGTIGHIKSVAYANSNENNYRTPTVAHYDVNTPSLSEEEKKANGLLMAAAPDMYELINELATETEPRNITELYFQKKAKQILNQIEEGGSNET